MKIRVSKKTKRILIVYLIALAVLYIVIFQVPRVTDAFKTTQVLENGTLEVSCEAKGYIVKDEAVCTAEVTGEMSYLLNDGTVVKKGTKIAEIEPANEEDQANSKIKGKYEDYLSRLKNYDLLKEGCDAPISGVFSTSIDGYEKYFRIENLDKIKREKTGSLVLSQMDINRTDVNKGEPIFKISSDDNWYIVCWVEKNDAKKYEEGEDVKITIDENTLDASVYSIGREGEFYKMVFYLNVYYEDFCSAREVDMTVVQSNTVGLIVDNECIISKDGVEGVYVVTKDGDAYFKPIKVKITDGKESVIYESVFVNDDYEQVETVSVYQEVLRDPSEALEEDMRNDSKEEEQ